MNLQSLGNIRTGAGRGSAAGSIVSYCLGITGNRTLKYGLIFERFLNKGRKSLPDIDMDFDERYRGDVIQYAIDKYGQDRVAHIVTFATIKAKTGNKRCSKSFRSAIFQW